MVKTVEELQGIVEGLVSVVKDLTKNVSSVGLCDTRDTTSKIFKTGFKRAT